MITTLHIKNVGIIDDLTIDLEKGLNVLTGETGAGKTLIIDSLSVICGGRFSKEMIRKGQDYSFVEMGLYLPNHEKQIEGMIIVSREITRSGKNLCKINGRMVTVGELKEFMKSIVNIHGQQDNQMILHKESHIGYLDSFAGKEIEGLKEQYRQIYEEYKGVKQEFSNQYGDEKERQRKLDLLQYQVNEIERANLKIGEEEELEAKKTKIVNAEKIVVNLQQADNQINCQALEGIGLAIKHLEKLQSFGEEYTSSYTSLKSLYYDLQEIGRELKEGKEEIDFDERERQETEKRLDVLFSLKRKYGNTIKEMLDYAEQIKQQIQQIEHLEEDRKKLKEKMNVLEEKMNQLAEKMEQIRRCYAKKLEDKIQQQLEELEMKQAKMEIKIEHRTGEYNKNGSDIVEFLIQTNVGEEKKELVKIASGGEMSRIMLAIKTVLAQVDKVPVLVFDEIDTGISGIAASHVAEKLKQIGTFHQVITVTHLGVIAAKGDSHYRIYKETKDETTTTKIVKLKEEEVLQEIARITTGKVTDISIKHALELRKAV